MEIQPQEPQEIHTNEGFEKDSPSSGPISINHPKEVKLSDLDKDPEERENWGNQCDFFLSALGYAVGLGNVWRFPMLAYQYGGGAFLIPYTFMLIFVGLPLFFMELALGQYSGAGPTRLFGRLAPAFKGLGFGMMGATFYVAIYYNVIIAWAIYYLAGSLNFFQDLPWNSCTSDACFDNGTLNNAQNNSVSAPQDYFNVGLLGMDWDTSFCNYGSIRWLLVLCLFFAWFIVGGSLIKGVQSSGKVVYFTALFPFVVLFILFVRGIFLPGALEGIYFYVNPDFSQLANVQIWQAAATQIFYSLGPAFGGLITLSSYNRFDNNCHRDAVLIAFCNCGTSVFAGFVVFSILGFMAHIKNLAIKDVVAGGPSLAFVVFPEAVSAMAGSHFWALLFFVMLITLGLDSMFTLVETLTTAAMDHFKSLRPYKGHTVAATCLVGFFCGIPMCFPGGIHLFTLLDSTCASWNIILFALLEVILIAWVYGFNNFFNNIQEMGMRMPNVVRLYWTACWTVITPLILLAILIGQWVQFKPVEGVNMDKSAYVFPGFFQGMGVLIACSTVILLPLLTVRQFLKRKYANKPVGRAMFKTTPKWKPIKSIGNSFSI
ncbi:sodium- and chloride-dependent glycine transporter 2-like [Tigriopus californicus]|uniref:sodium- and chloride-dependent glycine transporter 2-like n=1 Tax=Tigriopus californicus TaxID=6832 RepID=UPI0027DA3CD7|nr:sodium- and chloride-dependent glycine transporter 2-like [Tigriopus californicus]